MSWTRCSCFGVKPAACQTIDRFKAAELRSLSHGTAEMQQACVDALSLVLLLSEQIAARLAPQLEQPPLSCCNAGLQKRRVDSTVPVSAA